MGGFYLLRLGPLKQLREARGEPGLGRGDRCVVTDERGERLGEVVAVRDAVDSVALECRALLEEEQGRFEELQGVVRDELRELRELVKEPESFEVLALERWLGSEQRRVYYRAQVVEELGELGRRFVAKRGGSLEWKQLGARAKARLCGGVGVCGREFCCSTFMVALPPVTMRMARGQGRSLQPEDTAGACGRLKCCLRFEYEDLMESSWELGREVACRRIRGRIVGVSEPGRTVLVESESGLRREVFMREILEYEGSRGFVGS